MTRNRQTPRLVRQLIHARFMAAIDSHIKAVTQGDPKRLANTRRELHNAATSPQDRTLARQLAVA